MSHLKIIDLSHNNIHGAIPSLGSTSSDLEVFDLSYNGFQGYLTNGVSFAAFGLRILKLSGNSLLNRRIPLYQFLPLLEVVESVGNRFGGPISPSLGFCKNLTYLKIADNSYTGMVPSELGQLRSLRVVDVSGMDRLGGSIPTELGLLRDLALLNISGTSIAGSIPPALCSRIQAGTMSLVANCSMIDCC